MSTFSDKDIERKEAIERLQGERIELLEKITDEVSVESDTWKEVMEKVAIIDDQIHMIDQSRV